MSCFPCFGSKESEINEQEDFRVAQTKGHPSSQNPANTTDSLPPPANQMNSQKQGVAAADTYEANENENSSLRNFGFRELAMATKNFRRECLLGESRVGKVYKGTLQETGQVVAVKQLDRHGTKPNKEFLAQVMVLSLLRHPNLAELIGYCADGDQRILVYEYMEKGSLNNHLHEVSPERETLDWITRMKIASGAAQALEYLHEKTNPPILCRNFKSTNIMLDEILEPKLTDYGLVTLEIDSGNTMNQRIVSTVGCAPEYEQNGQLTPKSDVYSFGIVLLELITGRKPLETTLPVDEQNLVIWAQPYFKEPKRFPEMADPQLKGAFPDKSLNQAVGVAAMCVQDDPSVRPMISDVVAALSFLTMAPPPQTLQTEPAPSTTSPNEKTRSPEEPEQDLEEVSSQNDGSEDFSYTDSDDEDDESPVKIKSNKTGYREEKGGTSSSESLYNEDDYDDDEEQQEETNHASKSKPKSIKRKVTLEKDERSVSRNSSKSNNKSFKTQSGSSLRKKSSSRVSSRNDSKRVDGSLSKKPYTPNNNLTSKSNNSFSTKLSNKKGFDTKSSKNSERVDVSKPHELNNKLSSRTSSTNNIQSHSRRSKDEKSETRNSSFSSDSDESGERVISVKSTRKNMGEAEDLDREEELNARLFEDTYVPI